MGNAPRVTLLPHYHTCKLCILAGDPNDLSGRFADKKRQRSVLLKDLPVADDQCQRPEDKSTERATSVAELLGDIRLGTMQVRSCEDIRGVYSSRLNTLFAEDAVN